VGKGFLAMSAALIALAATAPAAGAWSASVDVYRPGEAEVAIQAEPGETNDITVTTAGHAQSTLGVPQGVIVHDAGATVTPGSSGCPELDAHTVLCSWSALDYLMDIAAFLGDGNDRLHVAPGEAIDVRGDLGDGDDTLINDAGGLDGGNLFAGPGNDHITLREPTSSAFPPPWLSAGDGDDTVDILNGGPDTLLDVTCDAGDDTLIADDSDAESPDCETRRGGLLG
jgi:hypothetical protein